MSEDVSQAVAALGALAKPAEMLIEKVSSAVGGILAPWQTKRVARAQAEAALIHAKGDVQEADLYRRTIHRWVEEEAKKQENMESITAKAMPLLESTSNPKEIEDDWIVNFFDKCRLISDEQMQSLWSKILAGEANSPGTFSRITVAVVAGIDKSDAILFTQVCGYTWTIDNSFVPVIYDTQDDIFNESGINFDTLSHLHSIGLIHFDNRSDYQLIALPQQFTASYYGKSIELDMHKESNNSMHVGAVMLTKAGTELASICEGTAVDGFEEYVLRKWGVNNYIRKEDASNTESAIVQENDDE